MNKISVIIPVYDVAEFLPECVNSVINQTYKNLEIILVDDGSTDGSGQLCNDYATRDNRITVIHKQNGGQSSARNLGLTIATGDYIYFLDSDDYISENTLDDLLSVALNDNSDLVFFEAESFDENGVLEKQTYSRSRQYPVCNGMQMFATLNNCKDFRVSVPLLFIRKSLLADNNLSFYEGVIYEDMLYAFQVFVLAEKVSHCHKTMYFRRFRTNSTMTSVKKIKNFNSAVVVFNELLSFIKDKPLQADKNVIAYLSRNGLNVYNIYEELSPEDKAACKSDLADFSSFVRDNKQYVSQELLARTHGKLSWATVKIKQKILH